jgi:hypothetical protein
MWPNDQTGWEEPLRMGAEAFGSNQVQWIRVNQWDLEQAITDFSKLIYATERRNEDTADRLIYEHRERFRQDLIALRNIRPHLVTVLRSGR